MKTRILALWTALALLITACAPAAALAEEELQDLVPMIEESEEIFELVSEESVAAPEPEAEEATEESPEAPVEAEVQAVPMEVSVTVEILDNRNAVLLTANVDGVDEAICTFAWQRVSAAALDRDGAAVYETIGEEKVLRLEYENPQEITSYMYRCVISAGERCCVSENVMIQPDCTQEENEEAPVAQEEPTEIIPVLPPLNASAATETEEETTQTLAEETEEESQLIERSVETDHIRIVMNVAGQSALDITVGQTINIIAVTEDDREPGIISSKNITYRSSDPAIATIDANGAIKGIRTGAVLITAEYDLNPQISQSFILNVVSSKADLPETVALSAPSVMGVGEQVELQVSFPNGGSDGYVLTTSDSAVMLTNGHTLVATRTGSSRITVKTMNGKSASLTITVKAAPTGFNLSAGGYAIEEGRSFSLAEMVKDAPGAKRYSCEENGIVTVSEDGLVTGLKIGSAVVTVTAYNGVSADITITVTERIDSIGINCDRETVAIGEKIRLSAYVNGDVNALCNAKWSVSNTRYAAIDQSGLFTAKGKGTVKVTAQHIADTLAKSSEPSTAQTTIKVVAAPTAVAMQVPVAKLGVGESIASVVTLNNGNVGTWSVIADREGVVDINEKGVITGVSEGTVQVRAVSYNNKLSPIIELQVCAQPTSIAFAKDVYTVAVGDAFEPEILLSKGAASAIRYSFFFSSIASEAGNGKIVGEKEGTVTLTAKTFNGLTARTSVCVVPAPTKVECSVPATTVGISDKMALATDSDCRIPLNYTYTSSNTKVATVSADGIITAKSKGSAKITAKAYNGVSDTFTLSVLNYGTKVTVKSSRDVIGVGDTAKLTTSFLRGYSALYTFVSDNESVAQVSADGTVTAVGVGTANVGVVLTAKSSYCAYVPVTVVEEPTSVSFDSNALCIALGDTGSVSAAVNSGSVGAVTYESTDPSVVKIDAKGNVTASALGATTLVAKAYNGVRGTMNVQVVAAPTVAKLSVPQAVIGAKDRIALHVATDSNADSVSAKYTVSSTRIATVSDDGTLKPLKAGTVTITAKTYNGLSTSATVTIKNAATSLNVKSSANVIGVGDTANLTVEFPAKTAALYSFSSTNEQVASVDENGVVHANSVGACLVGAILDSTGKYASLNVTVVPAPTQVRFDRQSLTICKGDSRVVMASVNEGSAGSVTYASSDESVVEVDAQGNIKAVSEGSATIIATAYNGVRGTLPVQVIPAPTVLTISAPYTTVGTKDTLTFAYRTDAPDGAVSVKYSVTSTRCAKITEDGVLKPLKKGSVTVVAKTYNGLTATQTIQILNAASNLTVTPSASKIALGDTAKLSVSFPKGTTGQYAFRSENENIITINDKGIMYAVGKGTCKVGAIITATGKYVTTDITVVAPPTRVTLPQQTLTICKGDSATLPASLGEGEIGTITMTSSDESVIRVDADGKLTTNTNIGAATITATVYNGLQTSCRVYVKPAPVQLTVSTERSSIGIREQIPVIVGNDQNAEISYTLKSSNTRVITIKDNREIYAVNKGTATITATAYNGVTGTFKVTVTAMPTTVTVTSNAQTIGVGDHARLNVALNAAGAYRYQSGDEAIATVDADGMVTGLAVGQVEIGAITYNDRYGTTTIDVVKAPTKIALSDTTLKIPAGASYTIRPIFEEGEGGTVTFESTNPTAASVDPVTGVITARTSGYATIKAHTYNNHTAICTLTVVPAMTSLELKADRVKLGVGETMPTTTIVDLGADVKADMQYTSSKTTVLTVSETGVVTAVGRGTATVTATSYNGLTSKLTFTVDYGISKLVLKAGSTKLSAVGDVTTVTVTVTGTGTYVLSSSNDKVLTVTQDGKVTAVGKGSAQIIATAYNDKYGSVTITVGDGVLSDQDEYDPSMTLLQKIEYVINVGQKQLDKPYVYGKAGPDSFDCSGFVVYCFSEVLKSDLPHNSISMSKDSRLTKITDSSKLQRGDLIFFKTGGSTSVNHVGIYMGNDKFIHASSSANKVTITVLSSYLKTQVFVYGGRIPEAYYK